MACGLLDTGLRTRHFVVIEVELRHPVPAVAETIANRIWSHQDVMRARVVADQPTFGELVAALKEGCARD